MAKVELPGVHKVNSKGKIYYYAWRGGPRLVGLPGSAAFASSYADATSAQRPVDKTKISGLITTYKASPAWLEEISPGTRKVWARWLDEIQNEFGTFRVSMTETKGFPDDVEKWRDRFRSSPRNADMAIQVFSRLLSFGKVKPNPCAGISKLYKNDRSEIIWTDAELLELNKHASKELMWATRLAALTGMRQADCRALLWSEVGDLAIERKASKSRTGRHYLVPMYAELKTLLATIPRRADHVLTNTHGQPWKSGLSDSFGDAARRAKIDKHFHDLRGTAATRLYLAGLPLREIAEILAWEEDSVKGIIDRYVNREAILKSRIRRLDRTGTEPKV